MKSDFSTMTDEERKMLLNSLRVAVMTPEMEKLKMCKFQDLPEEEKKRYQQAHFQITGNMLTIEELAKMYPDSDFCYERQKYGFKSVYQLSKDEMTELKTRYYAQTHDNMSYQDIVDIDNLVSDHEMHIIYLDTDFVDDDFFCNSGKEDAE